MPIAVNPKTGERLALVGGRWVPLGPAQSQAPQGEPGLGRTFAGAFGEAAGPQTLEMLGSAARGAGVLADQREIGEAVGSRADAFAEYVRGGGDEARAWMPEGLGDVARQPLRSVAALGGAGLGSTVAPIATGAAGAAIGSRVGPQGATLGALVGAAGSGYALNFGENYETFTSLGASEEEAAQYAAALAAPQAALDTLGIGTALRPLRPAALRFLADRGINIPQQLYARVLKGAGIGAVSEGLTEAAQTGIREAGASQIAPEWTPEGMGERLALDALAGGIAGGAFGGVGGAFERPGATVPVEVPEQQPARREQAEAAQPTPEPVQQPDVQPTQAWAPLFDRDPDDPAAILTGYVNEATGEQRTPEQHRSAIETPLSNLEPRVPEPAEVRQQQRAKVEQPEDAEQPQPSTTTQRGQMQFAPGDTPLPAPAAKPIAIGPSGTVVEPPEQIAAQTSAYAAGQRGPVFVDAAAGSVATPEGMTSVPSRFGGAYIVKPEDAGRVRAIEATTLDRETARARILGYQQTKDEAMAGRPVAVQAKDGAGNVVAEELVDAENAEALAAATESKRQMAEDIGGLFTIVPPDEAIRARQQETQRGAFGPAGEPVDLGALPVDMTQRRPVQSLQLGAFGPPPEIAPKISPEPGITGGAVQQQEAPAAVDVADMTREQFIETHRARIFQSKRTPGVVPVNREPSAQTFYPLPGVGRGGKLKPGDTLEAALGRLYDDTPIFGSRAKQEAKKAQQATARQQYQETLAGLSGLNFDAGAQAMFDGMPEANRTTVERYREWMEEMAVAALQRRYISQFSLDNKNARAGFEKMVGVRLPKTLRDTREMIESGKLAEAVVAAQETQRDTQDQQGLPSEVGAGQEPVQAQPVKGAGEEATGAGGSVQGDGQAPQKVARKPAKPPVDTVDSRGRPRSLLAFLKAAGGLQDDPGGELRARDLRKARPGLISRKGRKLDDAALAATEAGYIGRDGERGSIDDLLAGIDQELSGQRIYSRRDQQAVLEAEAAQQAERDNEDMQRRRETAQALFDDLGYNATPEQIDEAIMADVNGEATLQDAVDGIVMQEAMNHADSFQPTEADAGEFDIPFEPVEPVAGQAERPDAGRAGRTEDVQAGGRQDRGASTEKGAEGLDQFVLPGAEQSAKQAMKARDKKGGIRKGGDKPLEEGIFAPRPDERQTDVEEFGQADKFVPGQQVEIQSDGGQPIIAVVTKQIGANVQVATKSATRTVDARTLAATGKTGVPISGEGVDALRSAEDRLPDPYRTIAEELRRDITGGNSKLNIEAITRIAREGQGASAAKVWTFLQEIAERIDGDVNTKTVRAAANQRMDVEEAARAKETPAPTAPKRFEKGDRIVLTDDARQYAGRHGVVTDAMHVRFQAITGQDAGSTQSVYTVKTDNGAETTATPNEIRAETGEAPTAVPDPVVDGRAMDPLRAWRRPSETRRSAAKARDRAKNRRKAENKQEDLRAAKELDEQAKAEERIIAGWIAANPEEAKRVLPINDDHVKWAKYASQRSLTGPQENLRDLSWRRANADPAKWRSGMGVGYKVAAGGRLGEQTNRGFRIRSVDPDARTAVVVQVADTGLTSSGGNNDRFEPMVFPLGDLVRDKKYDVATLGAKPALAPSPQAAPTGDAPLQVSDLSDKAIIVTGDTRTHKDRIKALGGRWNVKHMGWVFPKAQEAKARTGLADLLGGGVAAIEPDAAPTPSPEPAPATPAPAPKVARLREQGQKQIEAAEDALGRDRNMNTARRQRMAEGAMKAAAAQKQLGETMVRVADAVEAGEAQALAKVTTKADIETLMELLRAQMYRRTRGMDYGTQQKEIEKGPSAEDARDAQWRPASVSVQRLESDLTKSGVIARAAEKRGGPPKRLLAKWIKTIERGSRDRMITPTAEERAELQELYKHADARTRDWTLGEIQRNDRLARMGITDQLTFTDAMRTLHGLMADKAKVANPMRARELEAARQNIPGYFPTPQPIIEQMMAAAGIERGMTVLEPSAGAGHIADAVRQAGHTVETVERSSTLRSILTDKGHKLADTDDFLAYRPDPAPDRVLMNPPFEKGQDIEHVRHAYDIVKPGGRVVAIMSAGPFGRQDKQSTQFRGWLDGLDHTAEPLPDGAFKQGDRSTGVATRLVVIDKPDARLTREEARNARMQAEARRWLAENATDEKLRNYSWEPVALSNNLTMQQLQQLRNEVEADPASYNPSHDSIEIFTKSARKKLDGIAWAITYQLGEKKNQQPQFQLRAPTDNPAFRAWFGDSKVVDANGEPLVMYHGTRADFESFDLSKVGSSDHGWHGMGVYLTGDPLISSMYADMPGGSPNVIPAYVSLQNPYVWPKGRAIPLDADGSRKLTEELKANGYDGVIVHYDGDADGTGAFHEVVAFSPEQIKSIFNRGTFSPTDSRISFRINPDVATKLPALERDLRARLSKLGISERVPLRLQERIQTAVNGKTVDANAMYLNGVITIALDGPDAMGSLNHEAIHALKELGLFTNLEWQALERAARADAPLFNRVRKLYDGMGLGEPKVVEEVIAEQYRMWAAGQSQAGGWMAKAFKKIRNFFQALGQALRGQGFTTPEMVFQRVESGAVGGRPATGGFAAEPMLQRAAKALTDSAAFKRWFGDSKVVDENGEPLVVYHGTAADIEVFDPKRIGQSFSYEDEGFSSLGFYFTTDPDEADFVADVVTQDGEPRVIAAYISLQNPLVVEIGRNEWRGEPSSYIDNNTDALQAAATDAGADGIIVRGPERTTVIAFRPEQIKSVFNQGTFDPTDPRISFQLAGLAPGAQFDQRGALQDTMRALEGQTYSLFQRAFDPAQRGKIGHWLDRARFLFQDRMIFLRRAQEGVEELLGRPLRESERAYLSEELFAGRVGEQKQRLQWDYQQPLMEKMAEAELTVAEVDDYLYALHAEERNNQIARINPEMPDGGSGITTAEAQAHLAAVPAEKRPALEAIADLVHGMMEQRLDHLVESGLLSQRDADAMRQTYQNYVPLRGKKADPNEDVMEPLRPLTGRGYMGSRAKEKRATGRFSEAPDVLATAFILADEAIVRGEKNRVGQAVLELANAAPDPAVWKVNPAPRRAYIDKATGQVRYKSQPHYSSEDTMSVRVGGQEFRIQIMDPNLLASIKQIGGTQQNAMVQSVARVTQVLSKLNTMWNPEFVVANASRDIQTALVNLGMQEDAGALRKAVVKNWPKAFNGMHHYLRTGRADTQWSQYAQEFRQVGGQTAFNALTDVEQQKKTMERVLAELQGDKKAVPLKALRSLRDMVENANDAVDNAVRLGTFVALRERGVSAKRAASVAKNLTVNFNRRGSLGPTFNAFFMFFNAAVQGTAVLANAVRSPQVRKLVAAVAVMGAMQEIIGGLMPSDEEDDELGLSVYDRIPEWVKTRNMIIPYGPDAGDYIQLPMPYGYNFFHNLGRLMVAYLRGAPTQTGAPVSLGQTTAHLMRAFQESIMPPGLGDSAIGGVPVPSVVAPFVEVAVNEDWTGRAIMPERFPGDTRPDSQLAFNSVNPLSRGVAEFLNSITGGNAFRPGLVDVSPEGISHVVSSFSGAAGSQVLRAMSSIDRGVGEALGWNERDPNLSILDVPFIRKVVGYDSPYLPREATYRRITEIETLKDEFDGAVENGDREAARAIRRQSGPLLAMMPAARSLRRELKEIRKQRQALSERANMTPAQKRERSDMLDEREKQLMRAFNARYLSALKRQSNA